MENRNSQHEPRPVARAENDKPGAQLISVNQPVQSLADRVIAFIDARMHIVEQKPDPQPMRKAG